MAPIRLVAAALCLAWSCVACAQQVLEIIPLRHSTVDQVLPTLRPLVEPGGSIAGQSGQLIVRSSPANIADLRRILEAIDRPARRLAISVRFDDAAQGARQSIEAGGRISNRGAEVGVRAEDASSRAAERVDQRLQVMEGSRAFISTGQSRTLPQRQVIRTPTGTIVQETQAVQEAASGFDVVARISGDRVFVDIAPQRERFDDSRAPGGLQAQRLSTSVSARPGEWFEIGGAVESGSREDRGIGSFGRSGASQSRSVWLKVEELR